MVINTEDTNYSIRGKVIKTNYSIGGMVINNQDTHFSTRVLITIYVIDKLVCWLLITILPVE